MHASHTFFVSALEKISIGNYTHFLYPQYGKRVDTSLRKIPSLERGYVREYFDQARKSNIFFENTEIFASNVMELGKKQISKDVQTHPFLVFYP